jgi:hypothetical protein
MAGNVPEPPQISNDWKDSQSKISIYWKQARPLHVRRSGRSRTDQASGIAGDIFHSPGK